MAVQFGVSVPQGWTMDLVEITDPEEKYEAMTRAAKEADRLGYDSIWLFDHFHTVPTPELETTFECFTSLAGIPPVNPPLESRRPTPFKKLPNTPFLLQVWELTNGHTPRNALSSLLPRR